jgi:hypothetical protein
MPGFSDGHQLIHKRMAGTVQPVMCQQTVEIGFRRIGNGGAAGCREELLTGLPVEMRDAEKGPAKAVEKWLKSLH